MTRSEFVGDQVLGDAKKIPFSDKSVDYVIFNNTLHHFGLHKDADPSNEIKAFFDEAFRVFRKGVFGVEMVIPHVAQCVETLVLKYMKFMPTFVCSKHFFERLIADIGAEVVDFEAISQRCLMSRFKFGPPIMDLPFVRLPAFLTPSSKKNC